MAQEAGLPVLISKEKVMCSVTSDIRQDLAKLVTKLVSLKNRATRMDYVCSKNFQKSLIPATRDFLARSREIEQQHCDFMCKVLPLVGLVKPSETPHDYSKDNLYRLVLIIYFYSGVDTTNALKELFLEETGRHFTLEAHHPEYEEYTGVECSDDDLREMAVDRLARNIQFGRTGKVDYLVMRQYLPKFHLGDRKEKGDRYWNYVIKYKRDVEQIFKETFDMKKK